MTDAILLVGDSERDANLFYKTRFLAGDPFVYAQYNGRDILAVNPRSRVARWRPGSRMSYAQPGYTVAARVL